MSLNEKYTAELWDNYFADSNPENKRLVMGEYIRLVRYVMQSMTLPSNSVLNSEDFLHIGILGLNEAIERFEPEKGVKFESYATVRIKGVILDEMRRLDWLSRTARKRAQELTQVTDAIRCRNNGSVTTEEIIKELKISEEEYQSYLQAAEAARSTYAMNENTQVAVGTDDYDFMDEIPDIYSKSIIDTIEQDERVGNIKLYLKSLSEKNRLVITLYYYEELNFKEIGEVLKISESRVCQIHGQVLKELRQKLQEIENA